ncbi:ABC transporter permease, partial [Bacillus pumilus]|uniref:ABC transporter permease n=1 Tax=Bacillus pumilus TaxID=1408 RepID=UPI0016436349
LDVLLPFLFNMILIYTLLQPSYAIAILFYLIYPLYLLYLTNPLKNHPFQSQFHISHQLKPKHPFYPFPNLFTHLPHLNKHLKTTPYIHSLFKFLPYHH